MKRTPLRKISEYRRRELRLLSKAQAEVARRDTPDDERDPRSVMSGRKADDIAHIIPRSAFGRKNKHLCHQLKNMCCLTREEHKATENPAGRTMLLRIMQRRHGYDYSDEPWRGYV